MNRMFHVARREFLSTVMTKGFIVAVVFIPILMLGAIFVVPLFATDKPPEVSGRVAIIDRSGAVAAGFQTRLSPAAMEARYRQELTAMTGMIKDTAEGMSPGGMGEAAAPMAAAMAVGPLPKLEVEVLSSTADAEVEKAPLREGTALDGGRLALVIVHADAVKPPEGESKKYGSYEVYVKPKLDVRIDHDVIRAAVIDEIGDQRVKAVGQDPAKVRALLEVPDLPSQTVLAAGGSRQSMGKMQFMLPFAFIMLLWIATMTGGQYLLTTTIEEKSNRIMEVLLSAVTPMQLMVGKILGQMAVSLLILLVYAGLGTGALVSFKMIDLLEWQNVGLLVVYFLIAFFLIASLMAAIGSAVQEVHEAQSLVGPIMMVLIIPMLFMPAIINNPNGSLATTLSFIPPISPFVMVLRLPAAQAIPTWQIIGSIGVGLVSVVVAAWAAAKIFRIGVLMYGKPPNISTLIKWIRMA